MSWYNPWGEAARLRQKNYELQADLQHCDRRIASLNKDISDLAQVRFDLDQSLRTAQNRITYLETRLAGAVFRDPKTGRLQPKAKVAL